MSYSLREFYGVLDWTVPWNCQVVFFFINPLFLISPLLRVSVRYKLFQLGVLQVLEMVFNPFTK